MDRKNKSFHLVGIGGSGMTPLAELANHKGYTVTGSDAILNQNCLRFIEAGLKVFEGHDKNHISDHVTTLVCSSAIDGENPELKYAKEKNLEIWHRSDLLKFLCTNKKLIGISGTHGKTSTTALVSHVLSTCGLKPDAIIGGEVIGRNSYSYTEGGDYLVAELDESDGSFLKFSPFVSVVNNIDLDHLDFYKDLNGIKKAFKEYMENTDPEGSIVLNWNNIHCHEIAHLLTNDNRLTFGTRIGCDIRGLDFISSAGKSKFRVIVERDMVEGSVPLIGEHNFFNILCTLAIARSLEIPIELAANALSSYPGVKRRLNCLYSDNKVTIYDDYAHNPGKISACIEALRKSFPNDHLAIIFQPHRYSRMKTMYNEFVHSFSEADTLVLLPIFSAGEKDLGEFSSPSFAAEVQQQYDAKTIVLDDFPEPEKLLKHFSIYPKTIFLSVGAGDVHRTSHDLKEYFNAQKTEESPNT